MKRQLLWLGAACLVLASFGLIWTAESGPKQKAQSGRTEAPHFALKDLDGNAVQLSDYAGKVLIVDFWATWCPPCVAEIPHFNALAQKYEKDGLAIVGISLDQGDVSTLLKFVKDQKMAYPIVRGTMQTLKDYGNIQAIPTTFVIDRQGRIFSKHEGYRPQEVFEGEIQTLLKEPGRSS